MRMTLNRVRLSKSKKNNFKTMNNQEIISAFKKAKEDLSKIDYPIAFVNKKLYHKMIKK